ncbi:MAG: hypothetical protein WBA31_02245, partial [Candidatus Dormiibacterota bacterium]
MQISRTRLLLPSALTVLALVLAGCGSTGPHHPRSSPSASASATPPGLLGLAGETAGPFLAAGPYASDGGSFGTKGGTVRAGTVPATAMAAVTALALALNTPGPPISTSTGLGYNLGSTSGYQLTTNSSLTTFNFHPNTPTDEVGTTPTLAGANRFAEAFLSGAHVPAGGGVIPLPRMSTTNGSDRTVYFQWSLYGLPVVNILGQPQEIDVDVATDQHQTTQLVGISGAVPYGSIGNPVRYPALAPDQVIQDLNSGAIKPGNYLLSTSGQPFATPSPRPQGPTTLSTASRAIVD